MCCKHLFQLPSKLNRSRNFWHNVEYTVDFIFSIFLLHARTTTKSKTSKEGKKSHIWFESDCFFNLSMVSFLFSVCKNHHIFFGYIVRIMSILWIYFLLIQYVLYMTILFLFRPTKQYHCPEMSIHSRAYPSHPHFLHASLFHTLKPTKQNTLVSNLSFIISYLDEFIFFINKTN
jgi:hypothetical protein